LYISAVFQVKVRHALLFTHLSLSVQGIECIKIVPRCLEDFKSW